MSEPIWSRRFAQDIAKILGFPMAETSPDGKDDSLRAVGNRLVEETTEDFRYLPLQQVNWTENLARFLVYRELGEEAAPKPFGCSVTKLREIRSYVAFLRGRYGNEMPADESDEWTDEDRMDFQRATWGRLEEEELSQADEQPLKEQGNAQAG